ncbi:MAG TPA: DUF1236 domain-containing protein [Rhizobiaceae bacterium]|nr:DUF1236 domain-containing protein [Rhizobiaceae bacterium]
MKRMLIKSAVILSLGVAPGAVFAQEQSPELLKKPRVTTEQQGGAAVDGGADASGAAGAKVEGQADAGANAAGTKVEGQADAAAEAEADVLKKKPGATAGADTKMKGDAAADAKTDDPNATAGAKTETEASGEATAGAKPKADASGDKAASGSGKATTETQAQEETQKPSSETTASIDVTTEQQTEIREVIVAEKAEPVDIDIDVSVGVAVPRTVEFRPLPARIIEIVPQYEGYVYFVLADGRIIIVEPASYEVVYIITA